MWFLLFQNNVSVSAGNGRSRLASSGAISAEIHQLFTIFTELFTDVHKRMMKNLYVL